MSSLPVLEPEATAPARRLPPWLKRPMPTGTLAITRGVIGKSGVATVCEEARCPNLTECWSKKTATFMILGDRCTRRSGFCAVATAKPAPPSADEPQRLATAVRELELQHVVITAVARDAWIHGRHSTQTAYGIQRFASFVFGALWPRPSAYTTLATWCRRSPREYPYRSFQ